MSRLSPYMALVTVPEVLLELRPVKCQYFSGFVRYFVDIFPGPCAWLVPENHGAPDRTENNSYHLSFIVINYHSLLISSLHPFLQHCISRSPAPSLHSRYSPLPSRHCTAASFHPQILIIQMLDKKHNDKMGNFNDFVEQCASDYRIDQRLDMLFCVVAVRSDLDLRCECKPELSLIQLHRDCFTVFCQL